MERQTHHANNFDFLRILASCMVLYSHHYALYNQYASGIFNLYTWGGLAVLIFFTISGYLVTQSWLSDPHIGRFFLRRFFRIWPALTLIVVVCTFILGPIVSTLPTGDYFNHWETWAYLRILIMDIRFSLPGVFTSNPFNASVNGSLWTIPYEVICYILLGFFGLFGLLKTKKRVLTLACIYLIWYVTQYLLKNPNQINVKREFLAYFLSGSVLFASKDLWITHRKKILAFLIIIGCVFIHFSHPLVATILIVPFLVISFGTASTPIINSFGRFGDPSYGIYLFAFPIQQTIIHYTFKNLTIYESMLLSLVITVFFAFLSWHLLEKQILKFKPQKSNGTFFGFPKKRSIYFFSGIWSFLMIIYVAWLVRFWPGILGADSLAIILESETNRIHQSGKPAFWFMFVNLFYSPWRLTEVPIAIQLLICSILFARALTWLAENNLNKSFLFCLIFIALAPSLIFYNASLYSDGIYATAVAALLLETWICSQRKSLDKVSIAIFTLSIPFAIFARPNGIANLIPVIFLLWILKGNQRIRLGVITTIWCSVAIFGSIVYKAKSPIGTIYPLVIHETVGFLEERPMKIQEFGQPRVTLKTLDALRTSGKTITEITEFHDHYYWDPLIFFNNGPKLLSLSKREKSTITKEFFKHNLWNNFPAFMASRVNIFLYAALASGGIPIYPWSTQWVLEQISSKSIIHRYTLPSDSFLQKWFDFSVDLRFIFWTPWLGIALIILTIRKAIPRRNWAAIIIAGTMLIQLVAIFLLSIAGEYRYLLAFFTAPIALLPIYVKLKETPNASGKYVSSAHKEELISNA